MKNKYLHLSIGLIIIVCSLYYAFQDVSLAEVGNALSSIHYVYLFPAVIMVALSYFFRAVRWRYLIGSV
jgi:uncharacterized membrane protein YbhN (UPF0104 family)